MAQIKRIDARTGDDHWTFSDPVEASEQCRIKARELRKTILATAHFDAESNIKPRSVEYHPSGNVRKVWKEASNDFED